MITLAGIGFTHPILEARTKAKRRSIPSSHPAMACLNLAAIALPCMPKPANLLLLLSLDVWRGPEKDASVPHGFELLEKKELETSPCRSGNRDMCSNVYCWRKRPVDGDRNCSVIFPQNPLDSLGRKVYCIFTADLRRIAGRYTNTR